MLSEFISAQPARVSALNGDTAALVIPKAGAAGTVSILHGQVYIYQRTLVGDTILVGGAETTSKDIRGTVYIFKRSAAGWAQQAKIIPKNSKPYDGFGASLSLSGNGALVGSFQRQPSLLVRTGSTWTETPIQSPGVEVRKHVDMFGRSVAIDKNTALITQPYQRAMVYAITPAP